MLDTHMRPSKEVKQVPHSAFNRVRMSLHELGAHGGLAAWVVAILFSLAMIFGWSFETFDSAEPLVSSPFWTCVTLGVGVAITVIAHGAVCGVFYLFDSCGRVDVRVRSKATLLQGKLQRVLARLSAQLDAHPFAGPVCVLAICWLPVLIGYAPALFMWDTDTQILQWFGLPNHISASVNLLNPQVLITQHHSPVHTALVGLCVQFGLALGNENIGIFIYAFLQWITDVAAIAWAYRMLVAFGVAPRVRNLVLLFIGIVPVYSNYSVLVTKDVLFAAALLVMVMELTWLVFVARTPQYSERQVGKQSEELVPVFGAHHVCLLVVSALGVTVLRSGMVVVVVLSALVALAYARGVRRFAVTALVVSLAAQLLLGNVIYPALDITPVSQREALSIPFQQVARFMRDNPELVSAEDKAVINNVLDANHIDELYQPDDADDVKATFNKDATSADLAAFFKVWARWFTLDPGCYISSLAANYYGYFYPGTANNWSYTSEFSRRAMTNTTTNIYYSDIGSYFDFESPQNIVVQALDALCSGYRSLFEFTPVLGLLLRSATYSWALVVCSAYALHRKRGTWTVALVALWLVLLIAFTGPMNGTTYFRYEYPVALVVPFICALMTTSRTKSLAYEKCGCM